MVLVHWRKSFYCAFSSGVLVRKSNEATQLPSEVQFPSEHQHGLRVHQLCKAQVRVSILLINLQDCIRSVLKQLPTV